MEGAVLGLRRSNQVREFVTWNEIPRIVAHRCIMKASSQVLDSKARIGPEINVLQVNLVPRREGLAVREHQAFAYLSCQCSEKNLMIW
jgi:hypothetical protein